MGDAADHIASWEAAGLIDHELATTLRAAVLADTDGPIDGRGLTLDTGSGSASPVAAEEPDTRITGG